MSTHTYLYSQKYVQLNSIPTYFYAVPADAKMLINNTNVNYGYNVEGASISYSLTHPGYQPLTGHHIISADIPEVTLTMEKMPATVYVLTNIEDATVSFNLSELSEDDAKKIVSVENNVIVAIADVNIPYTVSADGYETLEGIIEVRTFGKVKHNVKLYPAKYPYTLSVKTSNSAVYTPTITVNNEVFYNSSEISNQAEFGKVLNYKISAPYHIPVEGMYVVDTDNNNINISMVPTTTHLTFDLSKCNIENPADIEIDCVIKNDLITEYTEFALYNNGSNYVLGLVPMGSIVNYVIYNNGVETLNGSTVVLGETPVIEIESL